VPAASASPKYAQWIDDSVAQREAQDEA